MIRKDLILTPKQQRNPQTAAAKVVKEGETMIELESDLQRQRKYVASMQGREPALVVSDAFVRGMRDLGYKSFGTMLDELIDNSQQAEATHVHVTWKLEERRISELAVIDDGHGMDPEMIRLAVRWGGTHRENDRKGFGRYGFGLPSASVGLGRRFTVYSCTPGGKWHSVTVDIDRLADYMTSSGGIGVPPAKPAELPDWVQSYLSEHFPAGLPHGTVIVIDKLDRLERRTPQWFETHLLEHFGLIYRNFLRNLTIKVNGRQVEAVDPLFLTPRARFYSDDNLPMAEALSPKYIEVRDPETKELQGVITIRFAYLPPDFNKGKSSAAKGRNKIMAENNGLIILRNGRQIDVLRTTGVAPFNFQNNDRFTKVELDFPPTLDEEFSVTTSKQQVIPSDRIFALLKDHLVAAALQEMRARYRREADALKVKIETSSDHQRLSEVAMREAEKFRRRPSEVTTEEFRELADEGLRREIKRRAEQAGVEPEVIAEAVKKEAEERPYKVEEENTVLGPFFRVEQRGSQTVLIINQDHPFYSEVYARPLLITGVREEELRAATVQFRAGLELLLFCIGLCELKGTKETRIFYEVERIEWSNTLRAALKQLEKQPEVKAKLDMVTTGELDEDDI